MGNRPTRPGRPSASTPKQHPEKKARLGNPADATCAEEAPPPYPAQRLAHTSSVTVVLARPSAGMGFGFGLGTTCDGDTLVTHVVPGGPAHGVLAGDRITTINGEAAAHLTHAGMCARFRSCGSSVQLTVLRDTGLHVDFSPSPRTVGAAAAATPARCVDVDPSTVPAPAPAPAAIPGAPGVGVTVVGHTDGAMVTGDTARTHALISIETGTPAASVAARKPVFVACVLDRSGSMQGSSLAYAKKAATKLVKHLGEQDALHFVVYDTHAETVFTDGDLSPGGKRGLEQQIKRIRAGTSTNLMGGLEAGAKALRRTIADRRKGGVSESSSAARIMLFSDGMVNAGETNRNKILAKVRQCAAEGITVSSFGIGRDFDEPLMTSIAEHGRGYYGFLGSPAAIPRQVGKALHSLLALAGTDAAISLTPSPGSNARIVRVYGEGGDGLDYGGSAGTLSVPLGDLHVANTRSVLVELEVRNAPQSGRDGPAALLEMTLTYTPDGGLLTGARERVHGEVPITFVADRAALSAMPATAEAGGVAAAVAIQNAADRDSEVIQLIESGQYTTAAELQKVSVVALSAAAPAAGAAYSALIDAVLEAARDKQDELDRALEQDGYCAAGGYRDYCMSTRNDQRLQRRLSVECLRECNDSDDDRCWSDGWDSDDGTPPAVSRGGGSSPVIQRRRRRGSAGSIASSWSVSSDGGDHSDDDSDGS